MKDCWRKSGATDRVPNKLLSRDKVVVVCQEEESKRDNVVREKRGGIEARSEVLVQKEQSGAVNIENEQVNALIYLPKR